MEETTLTVIPDASLAPVPFLPSGQVIRRKLAEMKETRAALIEYMGELMEHGKHFYYMSDFDARSERHATEKPALTQDGARTLSTLFEVYPEAWKIEEMPLADGHVRIRTTVVLRDYTGRIVAQGIGTCSTAESRYAYRWVFDNQVPRHLAKADLRTRSTRTNKTLYRVPNEDLEDQMNTITKMSFKRGHTMAVQSLPCVSDAFEGGEQEDGDERQDQTTEAATTQATLQEAHAVLRQIAKGRSKACQAMFGTNIAGLPQLSLETLHEGIGRLRALIEQGHDWEHGDLQASERQHAAKTISDLYGDATPGRTALPDNGWRGAVETALAQLPLPQYATFVAEAQKDLLDHTTPPGRGRHLLYRCEQLPWKPGPSWRRRPNSHWRTPCETHSRRIRFSPLWGPARPP